MYVPRDPPPACEGVKIELYPFEHIDSALKRFKKIVAKSKIMADARRHEHFVPQGIRHRDKRRRAQKRLQK